MKKGVIFEVDPAEEVHGAHQAYFGVCPRRAVGAIMKSRNGEGSDNCWKNHRLTRWRREPEVADAPPPEPEAGQPVSPN